MLVYVDDILITSDSPQETFNLIGQLKKVFALKDLSEMSYFVGIEASCTTVGDMMLS